MKEIENIFSKTKTKKETIQCPNPSCKIIIDKREKQSLIATNLFEQKANLDFEILEVGDYSIGQTIIERKTFSDFVASIIDKRLFEQISNLKKMERKYLILESFDFNYEKFNIHKNAIKGALLSLVNNSIPIIYTENEKDTSQFLILTAKKYEKNNSDFSIRPSKNIRKFQEQKQFILEGFPGVGPTTAKKLLEEFKTLENIFSAKKSDLEKIPKLDYEKFKKMLEN